MYQNIITIILFLVLLKIFAGVTISLEFPNYNVNEGAGSIEVCAVLDSGNLQRMLTITLSTQQNANAQGQ